MPILIFNHQSMSSQTKYFWLRETLVLVILHNLSCHIYRVICSHICDLSSAVASTPRAPRPGGAPEVKGAPDEVRGAPGDQINFFYCAKKNDVTYYSIYIIVYSNIVYI